MAYVEQQFGDCMIAVMTGKMVYVNIVDLYVHIVGIQVRVNVMNVMRNVITIMIVQVNVLYVVKNVLMYGTLQQASAQNAKFNVNMNGIEKVT